MCKPKAPKVAPVVQQVVAPTPTPTPDVADPVEIITNNIKDSVESVTSGKRGQRTLRIGGNRREDERRANFASGALNRSRAALRIGGSTPAPAPSGGGSGSGTGGGGGSYGGGGGGGRFENRMALN